MMPSKHMRLKFTLSLIVSVAAGSLSTSTAIAGRYGIFVGNSSRNLPLSRNVVIDGRQN